MFDLISRCRLDTKRLCEPHKNFLQGVGLLGMITMCYLTTRQSDRVSTISFETSRTFGFGHT